jgi:hypothetical protein
MGLTTFMRAGRQACSELARWARASQRAAGVAASRDVNVARVSLRAVLAKETP